MDVGELRPRDGDHLRRGVQLHRARPERDHRAVECQVAVAQPTEIPEHLVLAVVAVEHRLREELVGPAKTRRPGRRSRRPCRRPAIGAPPSAVTTGSTVSIVLVSSKVMLTVVGVDAPDVVARGERGGERLVGIGHPNAIVSNQVSCTSSRPPARRPAGRDRREPLHPFRDPRQALASVPGGVETGDVGEQHLGRTDVRRGLLAADVLLAGLQREPQGRPAGGVGTHADDASGHRPGGRLARGDERGVRAAEAHRNAEALGGSDGDVGPELTRGSGQHARQRIGDHHGDAAERRGPARWPRSSRRPHRSRWAG